MKNEVVKVKKDFITNAINPISLDIGDIIKIGEEAREEEWKGWLYCIKGDISGYVPIQIIEKLQNRKYGKITEKYTAQEINVYINEKVLKIKSLNGWAWIKKAHSSDEGWIPEKVLE